MENFALKKRKYYWHTNLTAVNYMLSTHLNFMRGRYKKNFFKIHLGSEKH